MSKSLPPNEAALRGRIGAYRLHSTHDPKDTTQQARATFLAKFEQMVDPDGTLTDAERTRRATAARKAYFAKLALQSARARRRKGRGLPADRDPVEAV